MRIRFYYVNVITFVSVHIISQHVKNDDTIELRGSKSFRKKKKI